MKYWVLLYRHEDRSKSYLYFASELEAEEKWFAKILRKKAGNQSEARWIVESDQKWRDVIVRFPSATEQNLRCEVAGCILLRDKDHAALTLQNREQDSKDLAAISWINLTKDSWEWLYYRWYDHVMLTVHESLASNPNFRLYVTNYCNLSKFKASDCTRNVPDSFPKEIISFLLD
jgi:hypothetical protein